MKKHILLKLLHCASFLWLLSALGCGAGGCPGRDLQPSHEAQVVFDLAKECSKNNKTIDDVKNEFNKLKDPQIKKLAAIVDAGQDNFTTLLVKCPSSAPVLEVFLSKLDPQDAKKQVTHKVGGKNSVEILFALKPEPKGAKQTGSMLLIYAPDKFLVKQGIFQRDEFSKFAKKLSPPAKLVAAFNALDEKSLNEWLEGAWGTWFDIPTMEEREPELFKTYYENASDTKKVELRKRLWEVAKKANYAGFVKDISRPDNKWGIKSSELDDDLFDDVVKKLLASADTTSYSQLLQSLTENKKDSTIKTLFEQAITEGNVLDLIQNSANWKLDEEKRKELLDLAVIQYYLSADAEKFNRLYAYLNALDLIQNEAKARVRDKFFELTLNGGLIKIKELIDDMKPLGANKWGLQDSTDEFYARVAERYEDDKANFKKIYLHTDTEKQLMMEKLFRRRVEMGAESVKKLLEGNELTNWGIDEIHTKTLLEMAADEYYGKSQKDNFKSLYSELSDENQKIMLNRLLQELKKENIPNFVDYIIDNDQWGIKGDIDDPALKNFVRVLYAKNDNNRFLKLYKVMDPDKQTIMRNDLIREAWSQGLGKDNPNYENAVAQVGKVITDKFLPEEAIIGLFYIDIFDITLRNVRLLYAIFKHIESKATEGITLTQTMVQNLAQPMKKLFDDANEKKINGKTWQNYLEANNKGDNTSILDVVKRAEAVKAEAQTQNKSAEEIAKEWLGFTK